MHYWIMANVMRRQKKRATKSPKGNKHTPTKMAAWGYVDSEDESSNRAWMEDMIKSLCKGMEKINQNVEKVREELDEIKSTVQKTKCWLIKYTYHETIL